MKSHLKVEVWIGQPVHVLRLQVHAFDHVNSALVAPGHAQEAHVDELADVRVWWAFGHDNESLQQADLLLSRLSCRTTRRKIVSSVRGSAFCFKATRTTKC